MPLLADISTAQPTLQNYRSVLKAHSFMHGSLLSSFSFTNGKRLGYTWKIFGIPSRSYKMQFVDTRRSQFIIKAVATLENKSLVQNTTGHGSSGFEVKQLQFLSEDPKEMEEREKLRRMRISKANKGNTPWNKGRKHSPETLQRIKERTRLAMQDPKVKMKLINQGHSQSEETKIKIAVGVRLGWERRRGKLMLQEGCHYEWQNLIAEASRRGFSGDEELQWDSYKILDEQLADEWKASIEERKNTPKIKGSRRGPKTMEQRRKIAEAISAKWSDPDYRSRVCSALAKFHGIQEGIPRPNRVKKARDPTKRRSPLKKASNDVNSFSESELRILSARAKLKKSKVPQYKDPLASSKLEMIKNIRAQRVAADTKKTEAIERARLMIAEAEKAANALEATAATNPHTMASLIETRKLINEAIESINSVDGSLVTHLDNTAPLLQTSDDLGILDAREMVTCVSPNGANGIKINGTHNHALSHHEDSNLTDLTPHSSIYNEEQILQRSSNGHFSIPLHLNSSIPHFHPDMAADQSGPSQTVKYQTTNEKTSSNATATTRRWVRGRLVEVAEEEHEEEVKDD